MRCSVPSAARLVLLVGFLTLFTGRFAAAQGVVPPPAPSSTGPANIFYGAVPPSPPYLKQPLVLVFVHGLHGTASDWWVGNDMYETAFRAGYRTAFVSMNEDNSRNDLGFDVNGKVLRALLPKVTAHYLTDKVIIIGHSKGGIDAQAAMLDPGTRNLVRAVFTIASPNTGTELADWAFGPGQQIAGSFGLLTPGVFSLRTSSMAAFRAQADPIFRASGIPFFTIEGASFLGDPMTLATGAMLAQQVPGANDGLVPVGRGRLPEEWATDLGKVHTNHFDLDTGSRSFPKIFARLQALDYTLQQFQKIAAGGFGDTHNTWVWSMEWFQGKLYVGTGREIQCVSLRTADVQTGSNIYPLATMAGDCPEGAELYDNLGAEIWRYDPSAQSWERVYKSSNSVAAVVDGQPLTIPSEIGFRGMTRFVERDGTEALYVGGVTAGSILKMGEQLLPDIQPPRLLRSVDGVTFEPVPPGAGHVSRRNRQSASWQQPASSIVPVARFLQGDAVCDDRRLPRRGRRRWFGEPEGRQRRLVSCGTGHRTIPGVESDRL